MNQSLTNGNPDRLISISFRGLLFKGACFLLLTGCIGHAAPLRIMPVGDSITAGYTDNSAWTVPFEFGYRRQLHHLLTGAGYDFTFVGASAEPFNFTETGYGDPTHGGTVSPTFDLRTIGQNGHRGYGGIRIPQINTPIAGYLNTDNPDIILLMIGINGMDSGSPAELATLVNNIFTTKPNVHLILAQITPMSSNITYAQKNTDLVSFNTYIRDTLVPTLQSQGKKISTVDQYKNFLTNQSDPGSAIDASLYSNGINHPTNAAYDAMAATWFAGILTVTPPTLPVLDATSLPTAVSAGQTVGNFAQPPAPSPETLAFTLVAGTGATDNGKFTIEGNSLKAGSHNFNSDPAGTTYSIRVRATGNTGGLTGERTFLLTASPDSDNDGLPDSWEMSKALNLIDLTKTGDFDGDGLTDTAEYVLSTGTYPDIDPTQGDTDGDNLSDGAEIAGAGQRPPTNPTSIDTDGDGASDFNEDHTGSCVSILKTGTNPVVADSDNDGTSDGWEIASLTNPLAAGSPLTPTVAGISNSTLGTVYAVNVSSVDLLAGLTGANAIHTGWYLGNDASPTKLNDGLHGLHGTNPVEGGWSQASGSVSTFTLPGGAGNGWDINGITSIADWSGGGFGNQRYDVSVRRSGETNFGPLASVNFQPYNTTGVGGTKVQISRAGGPLARGVIQIRFTMLSTNGNSGRAVYRELDVFGSQSVVPLPQVLAVGSQQSVHGISFTWQSWPGKSYSVQSSENLTNWIDMDPVFPSGGVTTTYRHSIDKDPPARLFYRAFANP